MGEGLIAVTIFPSKTFSPLCFREELGLNGPKKNSFSFLTRAKPTIDVSLLTLPEAEELLQQPRIISMSPDGKWYIQCQPMSASVCNVRFITRMMVFFSFLFNYHVLSQ